MMELFAGNCTAVRICERWHRISSDTSRTDASGCYSYCAVFADGMVVSSVNVHVLGEAGWSVTVPVQTGCQSVA